MKCILAAVVFVAMAAKMAEACCLPDQSKADAFFIMNLTQNTPNGPMSMEISGVAAFAFDFTAQKFAFGVGPMVMKLGTRQQLIIKRADFLIDIGSESLIMHIVGPDGQAQCASQKVKGKMSDKHQCMPENSGLTEVMSTPEMTMYQGVDGDETITFALDKDCIPKILQVDSKLSEGKGHFQMQVAVDNIELQVEDADFTPPCDNPMAIPGPPMKVPPPEKAVKMMSSNMLAEEVMKRRR